MALNKARCRRCGRCRSFLVSHWIISFCRPIGGHITLSTYTYHTSPLFETLSTVSSSLLAQLRDFQGAGPRFEPELGALKLVGAR